MATDYVIQCVLTNAGGFRAWEQNGWGNPNAEMQAKISAMLKSFADEGRKLAGKGAGDITAVLSESGQVDVVVAGLSITDVKKMQREWNKLRDRVMDEDDKRRGSKK